MAAPADLDRPFPPGVPHRKDKHYGSDDTPSEQAVDLNDIAEEEVLRKTQWKDLFNFMTRKHTPIFVLAFILSIVCGMAGPANAYILGKVFDQFSKHAAGSITGEKMKEEVSKYCIYLVGLAAGNCLLNSVYFATWILFGETQARSARERVFAALLRRNMTWYDQRKNGVAAMVPRLQMANPRQTRELQISVSQPLGTIVELLATTFLSLGLALYYSWRLTLVILCVVPIAAVGIGLLSARLQPNVDKQSEKLQEALKYAIGAIRSIETVKSFNGQDLEVWKYARIARQAATYYIRQANLNAWQMCLMSFFSFSMFIQGFWYGSTLLDKGETPGSVLTTFWAALMACQGFMSILPQLLVMEKGRAAGAKLRAVMVHGSRGQEESRPGEGLKPDHCAGDFELKNVCFSYPIRPNELALNKASLFFAAGETTFVIGKSGSGKSTIGQALSRFYPIKSGTITLDGNALESLDINWLRRNITLIEQSSTLFEGTIFRNISYGHPDFDSVTLDDVKVAAEFALLTETINNMPDTWDTEVGAKGASMSGGQRQRVALARARLRDTHVLILDESTSALDYINRTLIMEAIRKWRRGRTTIIITHDISQIGQEDYVYILEQGRVVQDGYRRSMEKVKNSPFQKFLAIEEEGWVEEVEADPPAASAVEDEDLYRWQRASSRYSTDSSDDEDSVQDPLHNYLENDVVGAPRYVPSMFVEHRVEPSNRNSMILPPAMGGQFWRVLPPASALSPPTPSDAANSPRQSIYPGSGDVGLGSGKRVSKYDYDHILSDGHRDSMSTRDYEIGLGVMSSGDSVRRSKTGQRSSAIPLRERRGARTTVTPATPFLSSADEQETETPRPPGQPSPHRRLLSHLPIIGSRLAGPARKSDHTLLTYRQILSDVWPRLTWRQRLLLALGFSACVTHAVSTPVFAFVFNKLLTTFYLRGPDRARRALVYSLAILGMAGVDATANYLAHFVLEYCAQMWAHGARRAAMRAILAQPRAFFDAPAHGVESLGESLDYYAEEMRNLVGRFAGAVLMAVLMMATAVVWSVVAAWKLSLVGLGVAPLFYAVTVAFNRVSGRQESLLNAADDAATRVLGETLVNIKAVRGLALEAALRCKHLAATRAVFARGTRRALLCGLFFGLTDSLIFFATALLFYYGAVLVAAGEFSTERVLQVFTELTMSMTNVNAIVAMIPQMGSSRDTATRLLRLANLPLLASHEARGTTRVPVVGDIVLHDLSFAYPSRPHAPVLHHVSTAIRAGTSVALVGASGSGKSTVAALLLKLYPPPDGDGQAAITLSGRDIRHLHTRTLRSRIALVGQQPTIFPASVADNIAYGLDAGLPAIRAAAAAAGIDDFVASLPDGYDTLVGDGGGVGLSGGQAQRIAIARALARRPDVLVLDEATSALDVENARLVRETIQRLMRGTREEREAESVSGSGGSKGRVGVGMTVVIITHARAMMEMADRVVMLDQGRVVEEGTFAELSRRKGGEFARLLRGGLEDDDGLPSEVVEKEERMKRMEKRTSRRFSGLSRSRRSGVW
ncbi:ATP-dependent permease [Neofusicoccum ribis]|uniref:ATP-dependent permease n=1 Tax=Neofusicoccum ribis TaxID=45134 RepID=A0ABR3T5B5_9PEZI